MVQKRMWKHDTSKHAPLHAIDTIMETNNKTIEIVNEDEMKRY